MPSCGAGHLLATNIPKEKCKTPLSFPPKSQGLVMGQRHLCGVVSREAERHPAPCSPCPEASEVLGWWMLPNPKEVGGQVTAIIDQASNTLSRLFWKPSMSTPTSQPQSQLPQTTPRCPVD